MTRITDTVRTDRSWVTTGYSGRTNITNPVWLDYLLDDTGERIQDDTGDDIIIYSNSWFEQVSLWTERTARTAI